MIRLASILFLCAFTANAAVLQRWSGSSSRGGALTNNAIYYKPACMPFSASNTVLIFIQGGGSSIGGMKVGDPAGNTYRPIFTNYTAGHQGVLVVMATNVATPTNTMIWITNKTGANVQYFQAMGLELNGVGDVDKLTGAMGTNAVIAAGSITPSQTGDIIVHAAIIDNGPSGLPNASLWTNSNSGAFVPINSDLEDGTAIEWGVYNSVSAINPTFAIPGTNTSFNTVAVALKAAPGQGTARPTNSIYIAGILKYSQPEQNPAFSAAPTPLTNALQFSMMGNLLVMAFTSAGDFIATNVVGNCGNWTHAPLGANRNTPGTRENSDWWYITNATPQDYCIVTNLYKSTTTGGGAGVDATVVYYDVCNADPVPYDTRQTNVGNQVVAGTVTSPNTLTPSASGNLILGEFQQFTETVGGVTGLMLDEDYYDNIDATSGPQNMDQNGGFAHVITTSTASVQPTWSFLTANAIGSYVADVISFKAATQGAAPGVTNFNTTTISGSVSLSGNVRVQ